MGCQKVACLTFHNGVERMEVIVFIHYCVFTSQFPIKMLVVTK